MSELELLQAFYRHWKSLHSEPERRFKEQHAQRLVQISHEIDAATEPTPRKPDYAEMAYGKH